MPAGVHLMGEAAYQRHVRVIRKRLGLCRYCSQKSEPERTRCRRHLDYHNAWKQKRKAA